MYVPSHFAWNDPAGFLAFCRDNSFATVITSGENGPEAQHLPLLIDAAPDGHGLVLHGHAAVGDPVWRAASALTVFHGPHAYISAAWFNEPDTVPTWNYLSLHASGPLTQITDPAAVGALFRRLAGAVGDVLAHVWQAKLGASTEAKLTAAIRWFRIDATQITAKAKLSQNNSPERRQRVIEQLALSADPQTRAVGEAMTRTLQGLPVWPSA